MRPPDKNRIINAVQHKQCGEVPFFEMQIDTELAGRILNKEFSLSLMSYELPIDDYVELNKRIGNDMIYFAHIWRLGRKEMTDKDGRIHYIDGKMKTPDCLKDIWYPSLDDLRKKMDRLFTLIDGSGFGVFCQVQAAPFVVATAVGYEDYWLNAATNAGFIHDFTKRIQDWTTKEAQLYLEYPIDGLKITSSFITNNGLMCSPQMLEEFETQYLRQQAKIAKENDKLLLFHVDGDVMDMIPSFVEMGVDIVNPIDVCGDGQDIYRIKEKYGSQITLHGNIDINEVLVNGKPEDVEKDVVEHIEKLSKNGGYIVASSHDIHHKIPLKNFMAMRDAVVNYKAEGRENFSDCKKVQEC